MLTVKRHNSSDYETAGSIEVGDMKSHEVFTNTYIFFVGSIYHVRFGKVLKKAETSKWIRSLLWSNVTYFALMATSMSSRLIKIQPSMESQTDILTTMKIFKMDSLIAKWVFLKINFWWRKPIKRFSFYVLQDKWKTLRGLLLGLLPVSQQCTCN